MTNHAIIAGSFSDLKLIKTRSVIQIIIECPVEDAKRITNLLGFPIPGAEIAVAVARLNVNGIEPKAKRGSLAQQAGRACGEPAFAVFLDERYPHIEGSDPADAVRQICGVDSRAEFDSDPAKGQLWRDVHGAYKAWTLL